MNINKYIEQAYSFFTSLAKEVVKELRPDNKDVTTGLVEAKNAIVESGGGIVEALSKHTTSVVNAINDKEVVESVNINNLGELSDKIGEVIETLKEELGKIDKEIVVKNDLSQLTALFKSGEDKKDLVKALKRIEDGVKEEKPDYTLILDELVTLVENIKPEIDLSGVLDLLSQIAVGCNMEMPDHLAKYAKYDRLKIDISDEQLKKMANSVTVASGGSGRIYNVAGGQINPATEDYQQQILNTLNSPLTTYLNTNNASGDAFGRLRTSSITTLFDTQLQYDGSPLFINANITGGATRTHAPNESCVNITCGTASGDKVVSQTKEYFRYVPGKSMSIVMSRVLGVPKTNTRQRTGIFDDNNGLFFENNGSTFGVVRRTFTSGTAVDNRVAQADFNLDKLDGTGASGVTIDLSKANIFIIDFQWLGVGRVRFGVDIDGVLIYCHEFLNANNLPTVYMTTPNLPSRVELENTGIAASSTTLKVICTAVIIEDGDDIAAGIQNSTNNGTTTVAVTTRRAILSIRPKATFNSIVNRSKVTELEFELKTDSDCLWEIVYNGTLGGVPAFTSVGSSSTVEKDVAGTTVTGGLVIASGYAGVGVKGNNNIAKSLVSKLPFCLDINGANPTNISLVVTSFTGTANCAASLGWKEIY